jgi:tetratricopeptide (TPR) repeat protein
MDFLENFPIVYLLLLVGLLGAVSVFVFQQVFKTRKVESALARLNRKLGKEKGTALDYYELGSIQLDKRLYAQAIANLQRAVKTNELDGDALAAVYNALGYAYFAQEQYDLALKQYKEALKLSPDYVTAMNNLGHSYERKQQLNNALELYDRALALEPNNKTSQRRIESLKKRMVTTV